MNEIKIIPKVSTVYEVGAILRDSFGYDQTNYEFYCIIKISGDWVTVQKMEKSVVPEGNTQSMRTVETPAALKEGEKPVRKKLLKRNNEYIGFSFRNYSGGGWCSLWSGKSSHATHYA